MDQYTTGGGYVPKVIEKIEDTGLTFLWIQDLVLKILYFSGYLNGYEIATRTALPFNGIIEHIVDNLKKEKFVEVRTQIGGLGEGAYQYAITRAGIDRAREAIDRSQYAGPAPVPIEDYNHSVLAQGRGRINATPRVMRQALSDLILSEDLFHTLGPAVNSGASIFLYGPPGNGKTSIARSIGKLSSSETMYIPYSLYVDGQVIKLYDDVNHQIVEEAVDPSKNSAIRKMSSKIDARWVKINRPFIVTGGELTMAGLDLVYDPTNKYYEAAYQLKANGGVFLIDDFGRQMIRPRDLLNRWIVPLENRIDYLSFQTGRKIEIPFDVLVIFSTNLPPRDLVDEAFLRRLRHKIEITDPSYEEYREIFMRVAKQRGIEYNDESVVYLLQNWYVDKNRKLRASHPRDICDQIIDISRYMATEPELTIETITKAATAFFVDI